jgi:MFS transporter, FSR family, fosmidomycin resistance protein
VTDRRQLAILTCGHACADFCQGAVPALVPFLVLRGGMDFKATGVLVLVMSAASSLLQPLIGARADRSSMAWAVPTGVALSGLAITAVGVMDGFVPRVIAVAVAGLGVALFHPGGARRATRAAADRPGSGLGMFAVGGSIGFALAPALLTPSVLAFGLRGTVVALVPALAVAALLTRTHDAPPMTIRQAADSRLPGSFWLLISVSSLRAGAYFGLQAFLAAALIERLDVGTATANAALTVLLVAGGFGTYLGGRLADRYGYEQTLTVALALTLPAVALIELSTSPALAFPAAAVAGIAVVAGYTSTVVLGQRMLPHRETFAAGMTLGFAMGAGGLTVALLGPLADAAGAQAALWISGALATLAVPASLKIGSHRQFAGRPSAKAAG